MTDREPIDLAALRARIERQPRGMDGRPKGYTGNLAWDDVLALIDAVEAAQGVLGLADEDCIEHSDIDRLREALERFTTHT